MDGKITFVNVERKLFILVFDMNTMAVKVCYRNPICMPAGLNGVFFGSGMRTGVYKPTFSLHNDHHYNTGMHFAKELTTKS